MCTHSLPVLPGALQADGVIEILRVIRIDGDRRCGAAIDAAVRFVRETDRRSDGAGFVQHLLREMERQIVLAQDREHVDAFGVGRTEHFDDLAFRMGVARFPFAQSPRPLCRRRARAGRRHEAAAHKHRAGCGDHRG